MEKNNYQPTEQERKFMLTGEQKVKMTQLAKAFVECREAGIQFFTTDGENALKAYNTTDYDHGPDSGDNLCVEWQEKDGKRVFVATPDERREEWDEIPLSACDSIDGNALDIDFVSWGCCCDGLFAHRKNNN